MSALTYSSRPSLRRPFLVAAFEGWSDAGEAATGAVSFLKDRWHAEPFAEIDPEDFFDFQAHRPTVHVNEHGIREITWPATTFDHAPIDVADRDIVLLEGVEPSLRWSTFIGHVIDVARTTGAETVVGMGALLAGRPHTRPIRVTGAAATPELSERYGLQMPRYEGPTGILGVLMDRCRREDIDALTLWSWVPHYLQGSPSPTATLALLQRLSSLLTVPIDLGDLESRARTHDARVSEAVQADPDIVATVEELERQADVDDIDELPSGDEIAAQIERFLRDQRRDR